MTLLRAQLQTELMHMRQDVVVRGHHLLGWADDSQVILDADALAVGCLLERALLQRLHSQSEGKRSEGVALSYAFARL